MKLEITEAVKTQTVQAIMRKNKVSHAAKAPSTSKHIYSTTLGYGIYTEAVGANGYPATKAWGNSPEAVLIGTYNNAGAHAYDRLIADMQKLIAVLTEQGYTITPNIHRNNEYYVSK